MVSRSDHVQIISDNHDILPDVSILDNKYDQIRQMQNKITTKIISIGTVILLLPRRPQPPPSSAPTPHSAPVPPSFPKLIYHLTIRLPSRLLHLFWSNATHLGWNTWVQGVYNHAQKIMYCLNYDITMLLLQFLVMETKKKMVAMRYVLEILSLWLLLLAVLI